MDVITAGASVSHARTQELTHRKVKQRPSSLAQKKCFATAHVCYAHLLIMPRWRVRRGRGVLCHRSRAA